MNVVSDMEIDYKDILPKDVPLIGFGPASVEHNFKKPHAKYGFLDIPYRAYNKYVYMPVARRKYVDAVSDALKVGYRLLDYSSSYGHSELIGRAIKASHVDRKELFITTRVSNGAQLHSRVRDEFFDTISRLGVDYVDLLQFHWPVTGEYLDTWKEMERLYNEGFVKHLGVANCHPHHFDEILKICSVMPEVAQIEIHPLFTQKPLIKYYQQHGVLVEAYTPIARYDDRLVRLPLLKKLENKYQKSFVQIILRWHIQNGVIPMTRSMNRVHQKENLNVFDFVISDEDMAAIDSININSRLRYDPDNCDFNIL